MHNFTSHRDGTRRYFSNFDLPENPACWLLGHRPKVEVQESKYSEAWILAECGRCGRRASEPSTFAQHFRDMSKEARAAHMATRLANARRDPVSFAQGIYPTRGGYHQARAEFSLELVDRRAAIAKRGLVKTILDNFGVSLRVGNRWSESPYHLHVDVGVVGAYASAGGFGGRFASWLGRGHKRELALRTHGGHLWWSGWYNDDGGNDSYHQCDSWRQPTVWPWSAGRRKHRGWMCLRSGNLQLNPADELWGTPRPIRTVLEEATLVVPMDEFPGDTYLIDAKAQREVWAREHGPSWARKPTMRFTVDWRSDTGIPVRNHDWKGDEVLASGVSLKADELAEWKVLTVQRVIEHMKRDRRHYRYQPRVSS